MPTTSIATLKELSINTIRFLSADAVQNANSGHPGMPMGAAAMAYTLWTQFLKHNPKDPLWFNRDRFVLSAGHGSMLLYSLLYLTGYDLPLDEIKRFRQWGSIAPGHPERGLTPGVEVSTGPLGQGFGNGVGMAIAEAWLAARYNRPGFNIVDHYTYAICSDGDLMEGISHEAASLAGHLKLGKLIYLYDQNQISLAGATALDFTEDVARRFEAYGWHTRTVRDGNDTDDVAAAIEAAQAETRKPSLILVRTHIGYGSPNKQDTFSAHGSPLGEDELQAAKKALGWPTMDKFFLPREAVDFFRQAVPKGAEAQRDWQTKLAEYRKEYPSEAAELERAIAGKLPENWAADLPRWKPADKPLATRSAGGMALNALAKRIPNIIGGSADLNPSTDTALKGMGDFQPPELGGQSVQGAVGGDWDYAGRNLAFGVREHAMGAAINGMAAHGGVIPFSATFLVFSDYMRPAIRLGALSKLHAVYVFTHDSVALGEDGPTHEPIEHLASLRAIPELTVIRPADANETAEAWAWAIEHTSGPSLFALTRQHVPHLDRSAAREPGVAKGAYVLADDQVGTPDVILIGTGSEVALCMKAREKLKGYGVKARVVSMPSWEIFEAQPEAYRESVLPKAIRKRVTIEAASPMGWRKWAGEEGIVIGINRFGASAPGEENMKQFGFTVEHVTSAALRLMGKNREAEREYGAETAVAPTAGHEGHS
ncbi:MAG TPA: transketolase [Bryobacteraceae bacterium]|nr:transketolase [Bryobacteraceae bacterium]